MVEQVAVTIRNAVDRVKTYKEKAILLREIEDLHRKIYSLEGKRYSESQAYDASGNLLSGPLLAILPGISDRCFSGKTAG